MGAHLINGEFQSDKYPTCPPGKVPLSVEDEMAQDLLWEYAQRRRAVDAEFSADLETALIDGGYLPGAPSAMPVMDAPTPLPYTMAPPAYGWAGIGLPLPPRRRDDLVLMAGAIAARLAVSRDQATATDLGEWSVTIAEAVLAEIDKRGYR